MLHVEDLTNISEDQRAALIKVTGHRHSTATTPAATAAVHPAMAGHATTVVHAATATHTTAAACDAAQSVPPLTLIQVFDDEGLPHIISETHFLISSDTQHDNAMVQKFLDDHVIPYLRRVGPSVSHLHVRSDGCKGQFKCAANFYWVSKQSVEGCGLFIDWSFFESCHGKACSLLSRPPVRLPVAPQHASPAAVGLAFDQD